MLTALLIAQLWTSYGSQLNPNVPLEGHWESCRDPDTNEWAERIYDRVEQGQAKWHFHMGPMNDFGLYKAGTEPEDDHKHFENRNLLEPDYWVPFDENHHTWWIPSLRLKVMVSRSDTAGQCSGFYVIIEKIKEKP